MTKLRTLAASAVVVAAVGSPRMKLQRVGNEWKAAGPYKDRPR